VWWTLLAVLAICLSTMANLILLAENRISLPTQNRVTALRLGFLVQFLVFIAFLIALVTYPPDPATRSDWLYGLGTIIGIHLTAVALFTVTEDLILSRRALLDLKSPSRWSWAHALFRPGGGKGAAYVLVQMMLFVAVASVVSSSREDLHWFIALCGYICFFTGVPTLVGRTLAPLRARPGYLRAAALLFFPVTALIGEVFDILLNASVSPFSIYQILDPFRGLANWSLIEAHHWQNFVFAFGAVGVASYVVLIKMGQRMAYGAAKRK
jgi:hypothetical protein